MNVILSERGPLLAVRVEGPYSRTRFCGSRHHGTAVCTDLKLRYRRPPSAATAVVQTFAAPQ